MKRRRKEKRKRRRGTVPKPNSTAIQRYCTSKRKYKTFEDARLAVEKLLSRVVHISGEGINGILEPYHCMRCGNWHMGHKRR